MQTAASKVTRKKFTRWLGVLSLFTMVGAAFKPWKNKDQKTVRMLTEDGRLVEIDEMHLKKSKVKVTDEELKSWIKNK